MRADTTTKTETPDLPIPFVMMAASALVPAGSAYEIHDEEFSRIAQRLAAEFSRESLCSRATDLYNVAWEHSEKAIEEDRVGLMALLTDADTGMTQLRADGAICSIRLESIRSALLVGLVAGHRLTRILDGHREGGV